MVHAAKAGTSANFIHRILAGHGIATRRVSRSEMTTATPAPVSPTRLRFIDMARAVAILLMLEGHFVDVTLAPEWRIAGNPIHDAWLYLRGMAAPTFFTVTGVIFAYLLSGVRDEDFLKSQRVRRGLLRVMELMFWGYLLQVNLRMVPAWLGGGSHTWFQAFHVLQCIAAGLFGMIVIFGSLRRAGPLTLMAAFLTVGLLDFLAAVPLANVEGPIPHAAPAWLQNAIKGPWSNFPLAPWLAFTFYGAAIGVFVRHRSGGKQGSLSPFAFLVPGVILSLFGWPLDRFMGNLLLDFTGNKATPRVLPDLFHGRIGEILLLLAALTWFENRFRPGASWFQTIGRNTFPIYVGHAILLYGGFTGFGLQNLWEKSLNPWQATAGAIAFCGFFTLCAQFVEPLSLRWKSWRCR